MEPMRFLDRRDAGRRLAVHLQAIVPAADLRAGRVVVMGLPRGGVPVADEVSRALDAPLDVVLVRKLGVPFHSELAMGAIGEDGVRLLNDDIITSLRLTVGQIDAVEQRERVELDRRADRYRAGRARSSVAGKMVVVVDDGIATGATASVACRVVRAHGARRVLLAVPVAPDDWIARSQAEADEYISLFAPASFNAVGQFYVDFSPTTDDEVIGCLEHDLGRTFPGHRDEIGPDPVGGG
jgi:putative phosphoribosyl transferase